MKRSILAVILFLCAFFGVYGQSTTPVDLILLLDTSSDMSSSYENVNGYITGAFLSEFLRVGDTFHLIAFSDSPRLDVARRVSSIGDVETIIGRILLQYPVESGNNIGAAISFAEQYAASLPERQKKIVLVSTESSDTNNLVGAARQRLSSANVSFDFVQVISGQPLTNLPSSGRPAPARTASPAPSAQSPVVPPAPPPAQITAPPPQTAPVQTIVSPPVTNESSSETSAQVLPAQEIPVEDTVEPVVQEREVRESVQETAAPPVSPREERRSSSGLRVSSTPFVIGIIILGLLVLCLIAFFVIRRLGSSPNFVMAKVASSSGSETKGSASPVNHSKDLASFAANQKKQRTTPYSGLAKLKEAKPAVINPSGPLLLNLFVEDQNTEIGKRNIHSLKSGYSLSVGGGQSDFLIFLVPIPPKIGEIRRNGSQCTFVPLKPKYFPDLGSNELKDCINKTIRVISDKNYELRFRFEIYEDPIIALNQVLMSIKVPGL